MSKITKIINLAAFPDEAAQELEQAYGTVTADQSLAGQLVACVDAAFEKQSTDERRAELARTSGLHPFTVDMIVLLEASVRLREIYRARGYDDSLFSGYLTDVRCKLKECMDVHGVVGTFVFFWYPGFLACDRFCLGRLQFETYSMPFDYGTVVKKGDPVLNCHIPSSGPLTPALVDEALRLAKDFYGERYKVVVCHSWLLYPPHASLFPEGSNLHAFYDRFLIARCEPTEVPKDAWRIFHTLERDLSKLPANTSLQKRFRQFLLDGNPMGQGWGILRL